MGGFAGGVGVVDELLQEGMRIKMPKTDIESNFFMALPYKKIYPL